MLSCSVKARKDILYKLSIMLSKLLYAILLSGVFALPVSSDMEKRDGGVLRNVRPMTYRITHYDDHNGMSQWHMTRIVQDKRGFMWFATWNGLNRYDGYEFAVFKSQLGDGNNLTSDRIRNMLLGDDGNLYCL